MRLSTALLTLIAVTAGSTSVYACGLTDCLFGRYGAYYAGYPVANPQVTTYYAGPYAANYPVGTTSVLPPTLGPAPAVTNGPYQAQRPSYYDNPSVYTGLPVTSGLQSSYRVPLASAYRGAQTTAGSYTANYPTPGIGGTSPGLPLIVTTPSGAPSSALPATQVAPLFPPTPPQPGGLGRFFGSLSGTNYATSYYRAPVTYYRPATTVDPVTGTTITVQQPCTAYEPSIQRSPYNSLGTAPSSSVAPPNAYGASPYGPAGGVAPAGALGPANQMTIPIPSTSPGYGNSATGTLSPLSGPPPGLSNTPSGSYQRTSPPAGSRPDLSPVDQPSLPSSSSKAPAGSYWDDEAEDAEEDEANDASSREDDSYWNLQNPEDSTAMIRSSDRVVSAVNKIENPFELQRARGQSVEPIAAPDGYVSPYRRSPALDAQWQAPSKGGFEPPPLPVKSKIDQVDYTQLPQLPRGRVREAVMVGTSRPSNRQTSKSVPVTRPAPIQRDTTWLPVGR